jgi:hypothetical protein
MLLGAHWVRFKPKCRALAHSRLCGAPSPTSGRGIKPAHVPLPLVGEGLREGVNPWLIAALFLNFIGVQAAASSTDPPPYLDRIMAGGSPNDPEKSPPIFDASGWPRGWSAESLWDQRTSSGQSSSAFGLKAGGFLDTPDFGSFSGQATWQGAPTGNTAVLKTGAQSSFVLRQIGMPFDGGWRASNALGMVNLPTLDLARASPRLALPAPAMQGLSSHWQQAGGLELLGAAGQSGRFQGYPVPGFQTGLGSYALLGVQKSMATWQVSATAAQAQGVISPTAITTNPVPTDIRSAHFAIKRAFAANTWLDSSFVQANALKSQTSGAWLDTGLTRGPHQASAGLFYLQPSLVWLDLPMANDLQGTYVRHAWRNRQWSTDTGLELLGSTTGLTPRGYFTHTSARHQYSSRISLGGTLNLRNYGVQAQSLLLYGQQAHGWGSTRGELALASANTGEQQTRLQIDHDWSAISFMRLATTLGLERNTSGDTKLVTQSLNLAVSSEWTLSDHLSGGLSLQTSRAASALQYGLVASATYRFAPGWSVQANAYSNHGQRTDPIALAQSPLTAPTSAQPKINDRGLFVALRFETSAGSARAPVGGTAGSAAGNLSGSVYLDENKNGRRDAAEKGAANVTVMLDGRYSIQTDAQGNFAFNYITAGPHILTVISDNLPLPWQLEKEGRTQVQVSTRSSTQVHIGASKL